MRHRVFVTASTSLCVLFWAAATHAQIASSCLRPLGIPDKWIENQTPPWDPTDTFNPTGTNPDFYLSGFDPIEDHGRPMSLVVYNRVDPPQGQSAWPIVVSEPGGGAFYDAIAACSGYFHAIGESFPSMTGNPTGPFGAAMDDLITQDPDAMWDPVANGGRGGVVNSAFAQSPRIIALPAFAPDTYGTSTMTSPAMVKIVGFFVSHRTTGAVHGYLTSWSQLSAPPVTARMGEPAQVSATFTGPGSPVAGLAVEFIFEDRVVATAETDGTGTARPPTTAFNVGAGPGHYPGAIRVRLAESPAFFVAEEAVADLTVLRRLPVITWPSPDDITYGTPLGPQQLNATADVPGTFSYAPGAGTVLPVHESDSAVLSVTFVPADTDLYEETTAATLLTVRPAPLLLTVNDTQKLYLDPLPAFSFSATGFVNGDGPSVLIGEPTFQTAATASSAVGAYAVTFAGSVGAENYEITLKSGTLTIVPRPTVAVVNAVTPSPSTFGQAVTFTVGVSSTAGLPSGTVTLKRGDVPVATGALVNGQASISVSSLPAGSNPMSAEYAGAAGFAGSASPVVAHSVNRAGTATQLTSSANPSRTGQGVTFTATVRAVAPGSGQPTGSVEFLRAGVVLAAVPLANGTAQLTVSTLTAGKHAIQARYVGTANYLASASAVLQQSVKGGGK